MEKEAKPEMKQTKSSIYCISLEISDSNDPELFTLYVEDRRNLTSKFVILLYEYRLMHSRQFFTDTLCSWDLGITARQNPAK